MDNKLYRKNNSVLRRISKRFLKLAVFLGIPAAVFIYYFQLKNITVTGSSRYSQDQIVERLINSREDKNTVIFYLKYKYFVDIRIPFIEKMSFELVDKNSVNIRVYDKRIIGCIEFMSDYFYFDKDGIIVESTSNRINDIPLVKGLKFQKISLNEKLEVQKEELFDVILNLTQQIEKYGLNVNTISFNNKYEVTLDCGDIKARLGKRSTYDEVLAKLKNIMNEVEGKKLTIDMTTGTDYFIAKPETKD
ncbi:MAG TPA: cell division protein FtsQ/DivIB [Mobilitalea sp.]|nr:cell division protein FtsQ/DivIB [Mobilitalea sp.]